MLCPLCDAGEPCPAVYRPHARFHDLVTADPATWAPALRRIAAADQARYNGTLVQRQTGPPMIAPGGILIRGHLTPWVGFGQVLEQFGLGLIERGHTVGFDPVVVDETHQAMREEIRDRIAGHRVGALTLRVEPLNCSPPARGRLVWLTMWEATELPPHTVEWANRHEAIIVPCAWNREHFRRCGVTVPIYLVPLGVDLDLYRPHDERGDDHRVVFGGAGRVAHGGVRKALDKLAEAFVDAFPNDPDVRLRLKVWPDCVVDVPDDPRIRLNRDSLTPAQLAGWYRGLDVFCSASRGEGWGLQPLQAMACGVPVVAVEAHGHAEFFNAACGWPVAYTWEPSGPYYGGGGHWAVPDHDALVTALRAARNDRAGRLERGKAARRRAEEFSWSAAVDRLVTVLQRLSKPRVDIADLGTVRCEPCGAAKI